MFDNGKTFSFFYEGLHLQIECIPNFDRIPEGAACIFCGKKVSLENGFSQNIVIQQLLEQKKSGRLKEIPLSSPLGEAVDNYIDTLFSGVVACEECFEINPELPQKILSGELKANT